VSQEIPPMNSFPGSISTLHFHTMIQSNQNSISNNNNLHPQNKILKSA
jgi:hypothetical protein